MSDAIISTTFELWIKYLIVIEPQLDYTDIEVLSRRYDWDAYPEVELDYLSRLFAKPIESIEGYSDAQINKGLWTIVSDWTHCLFDKNLPLESRVKTLKHTYTVFEQLFAPRCTPDTSAYRMEVDEHMNPLNSICYMWWDVIPLYGKSGDPNREVLDPCCIEVMERTLQLNSIACQESALHGLGHWARAYPEKVQPIIDAYLTREKNLLPDLRDYALAARRGAVL
ncbi:MAG: hypothetical protein RLP44_18135 [Aggregatilineales bacterium]